MCSYRLNGEIMSLEKDVSSVLQQYATDTGVHSMQKVEKDFAQVTQQLPAEHVTNGLSEAFRSEQTPPFGQTLGASFEQGDAQQRAGMLNSLLDGAGPAVVRSLMENGLLQGASPDGEAHEAAVTPELAEQIHPELFQQIALEAEQTNPEVVERISHFYAGDPHLMTTLGGSTLSVALSKIAERQ
jgi:hypothetical protein